MVTASAIFAAILALSPLDAPRASPETREALVLRLHDISEDFAAVANEGAPTEAVARWRTALILGIAKHEGGNFERDVDVGPCLSAPGRCDNGRSVSLFQLMVPDPHQRALYQGNRREAAREAIRRALSSIRRCKRQGQPGLAAYASGRCDAGHQAAREIDVLIKRARAHLDAAILRDEDPYSDV